MSLLRTHCPIKLFLCVYLGSHDNGMLCMYCIDTWSASACVSQRTHSTLPRAREGGVGNWLIIASPLVSPDVTWCMLLYHQMSHDACYCITGCHMMHVIVSPDVTWCVCMIMCTICVWAHVNIWFLHHLSFPLSHSSLPPSLPFVTADLCSSRCGSPQHPASPSPWKLLTLRCHSRSVPRAVSVPHLKCT